LDEILEKVRAVGVEVAARHAADVDSKARFPHEAIEALKGIGVLGAFVPRELGGLGSSFEDLSVMSALLAQNCASTGMVLAMHHIQVGCLVRHGLPSPFFRDYLSELAQKQRLIASVTSEVGVGGDTRTSICSVVPQDGGRFKLDKDATTASYAAEADALLVTARRAPDAAPSDQVMVLLQKRDYTLEQATPWDTLGMRGTCSPGFKVRSSAPQEQIVPGSFADSSSETMVPFSHILWSSVWLGIATDAVARARAFVRADARKNPGTVPPTAIRLAQVSARLHAMRGLLQSASAEYSGLLKLRDTRETLATIGFALKMNNLKVATSEMVAEIVQKALRVCGILGYRNDSPFSIGRHLRDAQSAALMVANDRIHAKSASMLLVLKDE
jgi:acyl-CoA dehydrogenase